MMAAVGDSSSSGGSSFGSFSSSSDGSSNNSPLGLTSLTMNQGEALYPETDPGCGEDDEQLGAECEEEHGGDLYSPAHGSARPLAMSSKVAQVVGDAPVFESPTRAAPAFGVLPATRSPPPPFHGSSISPLAPFVTSSPTRGRGGALRPEWSALAFGALGSASFRIVLVDNLQQMVVSPWNHVPLQVPGDLVRVVCTTPAGQNARMEPAPNEAFNPLRLTGFVGCLGPGFAPPCPTNVCILPQTWCAADSMGVFAGSEAVLGDGCPLEILDVGSRVAEVGEVYVVKVLGAFSAMEEGRCVGWVVVGVDAESEAIDHIQEVMDLEELTPGMVDEMKAWLHIRCGSNLLQGVEGERAPRAYDGPFSAAVARGVVGRVHAAWQQEVARAPVGPPWRPQRTGRITREVVERALSVQVAPRGAGGAESGDGSGSEHEWSERRLSSELSQGSPSQSWAHAQAEVRGRGGGRVRGPGGGSHDTASSALALLSPSPHDLSPDTGTLSDSSIFMRNVSTHHGLPPLQGGRRAFERTSSEQGGLEDRGGRAYGGDGGGYAVTVPRTQSLERGERRSGQHMPGRAATVGATPRRSLGGEMAGGGRPPLGWTEGKAATGIAAGGRALVAEAEVQHMTLSSDERPTGSPLTGSSLGSMAIQGSRDRQPKREKSSKEPSGVERETGVPSPLTNQRTPSGVPRGNGLGRKGTDGGERGFRREDGGAHTRDSRVSLHVAEREPRDVASVRRSHQQHHNNVQQQKPQKRETRMRKSSSESEADWQHRNRELNDEGHFLSARNGLAALTRDESEEGDEDDEDDEVEEDEEDLYDLGLCEEEQATSIEVWDAALAAQQPQRNRRESRRKSIDVGQQHEEGSSKSIISRKAALKRSTSLGRRVRFNKTVEVHVFS